MALLDIFSKRNKPLPDLLLYDALPRALRVQIVHIIDEVIGAHFCRRNHSVWEQIARGIAKEHGILCLPETPRERRYDPPDYYTDCRNYVLGAEPHHALDLVEVVFRTFEVVSKGDLHHQQVHGDPSTTLDELNRRFLENGCGYQYEAGRFTRIDSQIIHAEAVEPALALLNTPGFEGPNQEFLTAHEHYRHGRIEASMTEACKAFESTLKAICETRGWTYDKAKATALPLIRIVIDKQLVPVYSEEQLINVEKCLVGIATLRNKDAGHGAGAKPRVVAPHYAAYALHLAASNIVFLVQCHRAMK
jgi:hypothetical protein